MTKITHTIMKEQRFILKHEKYSTASYKFWGFLRILIHSRFKCSYKSTKLSQLKCIKRQPSLTIRPYETSARQ